MGNPVGVKSVMRSTVSKYEQEQKEKFIQVMSDPRMRYSDALNFVENEVKQSKRMGTFNHKILCFMNDGVYQLNRAIQEVFGIVSAAKNDNPSGGDDTVNTIEVILADGRRVKVPYGDIELADLGEGSVISISYNGNDHHLYIKGKCQFRFTTLMDDIIDRTKELLATDSIYKSQALEISDLNNPLIMDLSNIDREMMVLSEDTALGLRPLKSRIKYPEKCTERGIPLKYGALFEGPYGTGKTLLAFKLIQEAIQNNWVSVYLKDPTLLAETIRLCKVIDGTGHGVVIFVEDIDQVTRGKRDAAMQDILNTLDGGDTKGMNVITLFTTNHLELIEPTFLRGKRIGKVISLGALDEATAKEFIERSFVGDYTLQGDFSAVCKQIRDSNIAPAFMAEIVESVKSDMIFMDDTKVVLPQYIKVAVESYLRQVGLAQKKDMTETPEVKFAESIREITGIDRVEKKVDELIEMQD